VAGHVRDRRGRGARLRRGRATIPRQPRQAQLPRGRAPHFSSRHGHVAGSHSDGGLNDSGSVPGQRDLRVPAVPDASSGKRRRPRWLSPVLRRRRRHHEQLVGFILVPSLLCHGGLCAVLGLLCSGLRRGSAVELAGERVELPSDDGFLVRVELLSTAISIVRTFGTFALSFFFRR
jgi:hypothetical protein